MEILEKKMIELRWTWHVTRTARQIYDRTRVNLRIPWCKKHKAENDSVRIIKIISFLIVSLILFTSWKFAPFDIRGNVFILAILIFTVLWIALGLAVGELITKVICKYTEMTCNFKFSLGGKREEIWFKFKDKSYARMFAEINGLNPIDHPRLLTYFDQVSEQAPPKSSTLINKEMEWQSNRDRFENLRSQYRFGWVPSSVLPVNKHKETINRFELSHEFKVVLSSFFVNNQLYWYELVNHGYLVSDCAYFANASLVDHWYKLAWKGTGEASIRQERLSNMFPSELGGNASPNPNKALWILSRLVDGLQLQGDDFSKWVVTHIGIEALVDLALSGSPVEIDEYDLWRYDEGSRFFRIPLSVIRYDGNVSTGYGGLPEGSRWDYLRDWVPIGEEKNAIWLESKHILAMYKEYPEFVKLWTSLFLD